MYNLLIRKLDILIRRRGNYDGSYDLLVFKIPLKQTTMIIRIKISGPSTSLQTIPRILSVMMYDLTTIYLIIVIRTIVYYIKSLYSKKSYKIRTLDKIYNNNESFNLIRYYKLQQLIKSKFENQNTDLWLHETWTAMYRKDIRRCREKNYRYKSRNAIR